MLLHMHSVKPATFCFHFHWLIFLWHITAHPHTTPTPDLFTVIVALAPSFTCSHTNANWHMACFIHCCTYTHVEAPSGCRISYINCSSSEKSLASTKWPLTLNLRTLYSRRLQQHSFFLPCHWQSPFTPSHVIMTIHWWDLASVSMQHKYSNQCAVWKNSWLLQLYSISQLCLTKKHAKKTLMYKGVMLHLQVILMYFTLSVPLCIQTHDSNLTNAK